MRFSGFPSSLPTPQELLAARQLLQRHVLVGLVRLIDAAGAAHHGRDAGVLEDAGLGAEGDQRGARLVSQALGKARDRIVGRGQEARDLADGLEAEAGVGRDLLHAGLDAARVAAELLLHLLRIGGGQVAEFVAELGVARHHVVGDAAVELAHAGGAEGHVEAGVARFVAFEALGHVAQLADHPRRHLDRIDRLRRERGMRLLAAHAAAVAVDALVRDGRHHQGRLADDAGQRLDALVLHVGDHFLDAETADLLVVAEGEVHRERRLAFDEALGIGQRDRDEALHVGRPAAIEARLGMHRLAVVVVLRPVLHGGGERVDAPVLAVPGHGVGMARNDDAGLLAGAQRSEQVGLGLVGVVGEPAAHAQAGEVVAREVDQLQVAVGAHGVYAHQRLREFEAAGGKHIGHADDCPGSPASPPLSPGNCHRMGVGCAFFQTGWRRSS